MSLWKTCLRSQTIDVHWKHKCIAWAGNLATPDSDSVAQKRLRPGNPDPDACPGRNCQSPWKILAALKIEWHCPFGTSHSIRLIGTRISIMAVKVWLNAVRVARQTSGARGQNQGSWGHCQNCQERERLERDQSGRSLGADQREGVGWCREGSWG